MRWRNMRCRDCPTKFSPASTSWCYRRKSAWPTRSIKPVNDWRRGVDPARISFHQRLGWFPALTGEVGGATCSLSYPLPDGVMVAQVTLTHPVMVRIHVGQPFDALALAHGRPLDVERSDKHGPLMVSMHLV